MHEDLLLLDNIRLNFSQASLHIMNITIGFIMFGVALEIKWDQFRDVLRNPRKVIVGLFAQYLVLPAVTFLAVWLLGGYITPAVAFGMILVASCPGGNVSNFISSVAKANVALSVSLTAAATVLALIFTPLNFAFWGKLYSTTSPLLRPIVIDPLDMFRTVIILLGIPVAAGIIFSQKLPRLTDKIKKPIKTLSLLIFAAFVIMAFRNNYGYFIMYAKWIMIIVLIHNGMALLSGYLTASAFGLNQLDRRTISIETGIQNSGLGLVLLFNPKIFPPELNMGGMAFIAAWWGIWHILAGLGLATFWSWGRPLRKTEVVSS
ncbi:Pantothenate precursors transporter PanS [bioreactor metagenome]|jgi:BASS family bile acid:Na+ symporter|uniref:Pantothenates transporter PanS n=1 Tax=bioreactor metagenome TaxID=1076179 RepID=A0A644VK86_9ZZZZ|nr:bile acid:sodium symporter family protein [Lentimicrobium sp.]MEA5110589.1 bile acid:sodium symporter family protein [Lentimicrobium sp.]